MFGRIRIGNYLNQLNNLVKEVETTWLAADGGLTMAATDALYELSNHKKLIRKKSLSKKDIADMEKMMWSSYPQSEGAEIVLTKHNLLR